MDRHAVQSQNLAEVGYCADTMVLEVAFHSGRVYQYFDVSESVYFELMRAESVGKYFNAHIRRAYRYAQL